jgi:hypothetical protein
MRVKQIHQVELTSNCNLACKYCAHKTMARPKMDMSEEVFRRVLELVKQTPGQHELNLAGIGESTLHPRFEEFVSLAHRELPGVQLVLATNGIIASETLANTMRKNRVKVFVSLHRPERASKAIQFYRKSSTLAGVSADPSIAAVDWAGQIAWHVSAAPTECMWLREGYAIVWSDGRVGTCSFDGQGDDGTIGTVWQDPAEWNHKPYKLCETCHQQWRHLV